MCAVQPATFRFLAENPVSTANYHWTFTDGGISIEQNPTRTFPTGKYKISLQTISSEGCIDSSSKPIQVGNVRAGFLAPATVCVDELTVFNNISGVDPVSAVWKMDGVVFKNGSGDASYRFTSPGTYSIYLGEDFGSCTDELTRKIQVFDKPVAQYTASGDLQSCTYPGNVQFKNGSQHAVTYKWLFGDGDSSFEISPAHTYTVAGQFSPMLIVFNANGCSDTLVKPGLVLLGPPVLNSYTSIPVSGCIPLQVQPNLNIAAPEPIVSYNWDFGDGNTSNISNPSHTYTTVGRYDISIAVKTAGGCNAVFTITNAVNTGKVVIPDFTANKTEVCGNDPVQFTATASGAVTSWQWNLTDTIIKEQNPLFRFKTTGYKTITLTAKNFGCANKITREAYVLVKPPLSAKNISYDCNNRLNLIFRDTSQQALTWFWDFGDGTSSTLQNPPTHAYPGPGRYLVTLQTTNEGCNNTDSNYIAVTNELPQFTYNPPDGYICLNSNITVGVTSGAYIQDYSWNLGNGAQVFSEADLQYTYRSKGTFYPSLTVKYTTGCIDSVFSQVPVNVNAPFASFSATRSTVCAKDTVTFTDDSQNDGVHEITSRIWDFGDTQSSGNNDTPFAHLYEEAGNYHVKLTVTDNNHCSDTAEQLIVVNELPLLSAGSDSIICEGNAVQLQASGAVSYTWQQNRELSCTNCTSPKAKPIESATYYVVGTGVNGCHARDSVFIEVIHPSSLSLANTSLDICAGKTVQLLASGADFYTWEPAASINNPAIPNPVAAPAETTTYTVTATDSFHCFVQKGSVVVQVHQNPQVTISNPLIEVEEGSQNRIVTAVNEDISQWVWYPPDGLSCADCPAPIATAKANVTYTAIASNSYGCSDTATFTIHILCNSSRIYIPTGFTPNSDGRNDRFYIQSSSRAPLRSFVIYSRTGKSVFAKQNITTNNAAEGWDGSYNGMQMPAGVYIFMAEVSCNGQPVPLKGTITLIR